MESGQPPVVVIGASAGGIQALIQVVSGLPADFASPVLVVVHIGTNPSMLPTLLERSGHLAASHAVDGEALNPRHIYVAPPGFHLLLEPERVRLSGISAHARPG